MLVGPAVHAHKRPLTAEPDPLQDRLRVGVLHADVHEDSLSARAVQKLHQKLPGELTVPCRDPRAEVVGAPPDPAEEIPGNLAALIGHGGKLGRLLPKCREQSRAVCAKQPGIAVTDPANIFRFHLLYGCLLLRYCDSVPPFDLVLV